MKEKVSVVEIIVALIVGAIFALMIGSRVWRLGRNTLPLLGVRRGMVLRGRQACGQQHELLPYVWRTNG